MVDIGLNLPFGRGLGVEEISLRFLFIGVLCMVNSFMLARTVAKMKINLFFHKHLGQVVINILFHIFHKGLEGGLIRYTLARQLRFCYGKRLKIIIRLFQLLIFLRVLYIDIRFFRGLFIGVGLFRR